MSELTKYWTAPGATLFLEEPTPQTFIPRWGWSFPGEAVYKAADVEANNAVQMDCLETAGDIIANVSTGDWELQSSEWQQAAQKWRTQYFDLLRHAITPPKEEV